MTGKSIQSPGSEEVFRLKCTKYVYSSLQLGRLSHAQPYEAKRTGIMLSPFKRQGNREAEGLVQTNIAKLCQIAPLIYLITVLFKNFLFEIISHLQNSFRE